MSRQQRYMRTERQRRLEHYAPARVNTGREQDDRARYGGFAMWFVAFLLVATAAAVVGAVAFWPD